MDLDKLRNSARKEHIPVISDDAKTFLARIVRQKQPRRILEIGTAIGYSGTIMLNACPQAVLNTIEFDEENAKRARRNFAEAGLSERVNLFLGDAKEIVPQLSGKYDFIFMDGPKGQYGVFFPYLCDVLEIQGTLVCDNVLYKGLVENIPDKRHKHITAARNMHGFLEEIVADVRFKTEIFRIGDGISISVKTAD